MEELIFEVGDTVYVTEYDAVGEVISVDANDAFFPYLVEFWHNERYETDWFAPDGISPEEEE